MPPVNPNESAVLERALQALQNDAPEQAQKLAEQFLPHSDQRADWLVVLALSLSAQRQAEAALPMYRELTTLQPAVPEHWSNLGNCLCELAREREALPALERALALGADDPGTHFAAASALLAAGNAPRAALHIGRARQFDAGDPEFALLQARIELASDRLDEALLLLDQLNAASIPADLRSELGYAQLQSGQYDKARASFELAIAAAPDDPDPRIGLALALERCNQVDAAIAARAALVVPRAARNAERLQQKINELDGRLATRAGNHAEAQQHLTRMLVGEIADPAYRANLQFELGRSYDQTRNPDAAMAAFEQAHAARIAQVRASRPEIGAADELLTILDEPLPQRSPVPSSQIMAPGQRDPVFLVGFPRSGTTLLEQLLDAHSGLASFDEQPFLQRLVKRLVDREPRYSHALSTLDAPTIAELRRSYFRDVLSAVPALGERRAVDKNPLNLVRAPVMQALFPQARVLFALRHPCDVVLSCYMQSFRAPAFAFTFETLASTAVMYDRVMRYWTQIRQDFDLPVHVLRYEDLVDDVETTARALFEFLELEWDDRLLEFTQRARQRGAISTPSYAQVVEPVNKKAVGRWQRYRKWFDGGALQTLQPWIERFGYESPM